MKQRIREIVGSERVRPARRAAMGAIARSYRGRRVILPVRTELPVLLNERGLTGRGAEIGVARGEFSEHILDRWQGRELISIDPWREFAPEVYADVTNVRQSAQDKSYEEASARLARFGDRSTIWRLTSLEAAERIDDGSLDFVYIDARHDYASVLEDIGAWYPKVRRGGIVAGHDYLDGEREQGIHGVKSAVQEFFGARGHRVTSTFFDSPWDSWLVVLPR